jgi:CheY-like chemotaxis protein
MSQPATCHLLVIDDHDSLRRNLVALLEDEGFCVEEAESGEAALEIIARHAIHLAIVDMRLPGISGSEFIETAAQHNPDLRFIVHTGSVDYQLNAEARAYGLSEADVFYKPIADLYTFFARIRTRCAGVSP